MTNGTAFMPAQKRAASKRAARTAAPVIEYCFAAFLVAIAAALGLGLLWMQARATDFGATDGLPSQRELNDSLSENEWNQWDDVVKQASSTIDKMFPTIDWGYWQDINPDVIGWISVPGTNIDYPIVQAHAENPTFYLSHDVYGKFNYLGVPYLDCTCSEQGLESLNATVFGHHSQDDALFSMFSEYSSKGFAESHPYLLLQTPECKRVLQVDWVDVVDARTYKNRTEFDGIQDYRNWYTSTSQDATVVMSEAERGEAPSRSCLFVTCSYTTFENERTIVSASDRYMSTVEPSPASAPR